MYHWNRCVNTLLSLLILTIYSPCIEPPGMLVQEKDAEAGSGVCNKLSSACNVQLETMAEVVCVRGVGGHDTALCLGGGQQMPFVPRPCRGHRRLCSVRGVTNQTSEQN